MSLVRVAVPIPRNETYVYEFPENENLEPGLRVLVPLGRRRVWGTVLGEERARPTVIVKPIAGIPEPRLVIPPDLLELARWVADYYAATLGEVLHAAAPAPAALTRRTPRSELEEAEGYAAPAPPARARLNEEQRTALEAIEIALRRGGFHPFLLHGVTASGKTAVYIHAALEALRQRAQVLVLVPEIALAPQTLEAFRSAGVERAAIYHSTLRPRERADVWRAASGGALDVVVGTRSAVFVPFRNLRLVVVDEEQDGAYKQDETPRYNARDVALVRAKRCGAAAVLTSATPSLESFAHARRGTYTILSLPRRIDGRPLASVRIVDLRVRGGSPARSSRTIGPALNEALEASLARGEQAIFFLNRRGHSTYLQCRGCGEVARCTRCDVSLTVHAADAMLRCHYCGAERALARTCSGCGAADRWFGGVGIQKVERDLATLFPRARLARFDLDSVRRRGAAADILRAFRAGAIDVLLGTQMVTKGFDFPRVTLVGIIVADLQLHLPDFRAAERTFQLLTQAAGRAGRGEAPGEVVMQTYDPDHPALRCAAAQDYGAFFAKEAAERRELGYPPFGHLVEIEIRGRKPERVERTGEELKRTLAKAASDRVEILGPAPKPLARLRGLERWHLLLRSTSRVALRRLVHDALPTLRSTRHPGVHLVVDVDPRQLL